jgi:hypothetical protein
MKTIRLALPAIAVCVIMSCTAHYAQPYMPKDDPGTVTLPDPTNNNIPAWRGFNKLNLFLISSGPGYDDCGTDIRESDFALMRQMGFNFVRFPIDYHFIYNPSTKKFDMEKIAWIDHAIEYGIKYNVHVNLNIHTAPGYSVAPLEDGMDVFTTGKPHFIAIWQFFAKRYKNIPNTVLSFNLLNEPDANMVFDNTGLALAQPYISLMKDTINAIRKERPDRLIILDVNQRQPHNLSQLGISIDNIYLSSRGYAPWSVTHEGMMGQTQIPANFTNAQLTWPIRNYYNGFIYAPWHSTHLFGVENTRAVFNHPSGFAAGTASMFLVDQYLLEDTLAIICDGVETARIVSVNPNLGGKKNRAEASVKREDMVPWTVTFPDNSIPAGTKRVEIIDAVGDTVNVDKYEVSGVTIKCTNIDWLFAPSEMTVGVDALTDAKTLRNLILPSPVWDNLPVMIGEMGCMAQNAEQAAYRARLFKDYADAFADLPWAFWEFKNGAMSLFNLTQTEVCDTPVEVEYGDGQTQTYYYDKLWYDAIKHRLNIDE